MKDDPYKELMNFDPTDSAIESESRGRLSESVLAALSKWTKAIKPGWESNYIASISRQVIDGRPLSDKQMFHLSNIVQSVGIRVSAGAQYDGSLFYDIAERIVENVGREKMKSFAAELARRKR